MSQLFYAHDGNVVERKDLESWLNDDYSFITGSFRLKDDFLFNLKDHDISLLFNELKIFMEDIMFFYKQNGEYHVFHNNDSYILEKSEFNQMLDELSFEIAPDTNFSETKFFPSKSTFKI